MKILELVHINSIFFCISDILLVLLEVISLSKIFGLLLLNNDNYLKIYVK